MAELYNIRDRIYEVRAMKKSLLVVACFLAGCTSNVPHRSVGSMGVADCTQSEKTACGNGYYEKHSSYDLGFVEYTERGNDFYPERTKKLLDAVSKYGEGDGVAIIVFVHGWKHNASPEDDNVISFKDSLDTLAKLNIVGGRKIFGIYVGWRGLSVHGLQSEQLTYWDRKGTAEQVGKGGVTQLLLNLEHIDRKNEKNIMLTIGHSFGGAVVLSALNEVLLERMISARQGIGIKSFGNGVILLNPAIEANKALLLKENSMQIGVEKIPTPSLLYVISSEGDTATTTPFRVGQFFGTNLMWNQVDIDREYNNMKYTLKEDELDNTTIGNYEPFWTGTLEDVEMKSARLKESNTAGLLSDKSTYPVINWVVGGLGLGGGKIVDRWTYKSFCEGALNELRSAQLPCFDNEPIDFFRVPSSFIENHNDVFNNNVIALVSAIASKSIRQAQPPVEGPYTVCSPKGAFDFWPCFADFYKDVSSIRPDKVK